MIKKVVRFQLEKIKLLSESEREQKNESQERKNLVPVSIFIVVLFMTFGIELTGRICTIGNGECGIKTRIIYHSTTRGGRDNR